MRGMSVIYPSDCLSEGDVSGRFCMTQRHTQSQTNSSPSIFSTNIGTVRDDPALSLVFGIGKRICPGRHLVEAEVFIVTSSIISIFNVTKAKDENGNEIPVKVAVIPNRGTTL